MVTVYRILNTQIVFFIQKQLFVPPSQRLDDKQDRERDMERAFEDLFLANNGLFNLGKLESYISHVDNFGDNNIMYLVINSQF